MPHVEVIRYQIFCKVASHAALSLHDFAAGVHSYCLKRKVFVPVPVREYSTRRQRCDHDKQEDCSNGNASSAHGIG